MRSLHLATFVALTLSPLAARADDFHVTPTGTPAGDGSELSPWDIATAFQHPATVMPGDTIWLHDGTYAIVGTLNGQLTGNARTPVVIRQAPGERATLDTGASAANRIAIGGAYAWYWGFEVMSSSDDRWADDGISADRGYSIDVNSGAGIKLINLVVHDTQGAIGFWSAVTEGEVHGCLIYYNGFDYTDRGHGHGIYTQNIAGEKKLSDNILFGAYSHGIHAYTEGGLINDFLLEGNIGFENGVVSTISGRTRNILIGGAPVAEDPIARDNYTYFLPGSEGTSCDLGYGSGTANAIVENNVLVGGDTAFRIDSSNPNVTGNTFYGPLQGADPGTFPNNDYFDASAPTGVIVEVRPNAYESGRGHVVVFNWDGLPEVAVDPTGVLLPDDTYELRDAQNYFGTPVATGTYDGQPLTIPMTSTEVAPVIGMPAKPYVHTPSTFGAFVLLKTGTDPGGTGGGGAGAGGEGTGGMGSPAGTGGAAGNPADPAEPSGCACRQAGGQSRDLPVWPLAFVALAMRRRRGTGAGESGSEASIGHANLTATHPCA